MPHDGPRSTQQCLLLLCLNLYPMIVFVNCQARLQPEHKVVYGKYIYEHFGLVDDSNNAYYLFRPPANLDPSRVVAGGLAPVIVQFTGNCWLHRDLYHPPRSFIFPFPERTPAINDYNANGLAFASVGYRSLDVGYFYLENGVRKREELIHVDEQGRLTLDTTGLTMANYSVRACWQEVITKPLFDAVAALEHIVQNAQANHLDPHRIFFIAGSAGTSLANYLSFVYHKFNYARFTPFGMALVTPQFDLPLYCGLDITWKDWIDHYGDTTLLSRFMTEQDCPLYIGNPLCAPGPAQASALSHGIQIEEICNVDWNIQTMNAFCGANFPSTTLADLYSRQKWNVADPEVGPGMQKLWYVSQTMLDHQPRPFHVLADGLEDTMFHNSMYALEYAETAAKVGLNYTVNTFSSYGSSERWRYFYAEVTNIPRGGMASEHLLYACNAMSIAHCMPKQPLPAPKCPNQFCLVKETPRPVVLT